MVRNCLIAATLAMLAADAHAAPFVAGFDRFFGEDGAELATGGKLLIAELSCTACHATKITLLKPKRGPVLSSVGNRVQPDWLRRFLADPEKTKPGTTMPDMLHPFDHRTKQDSIDALVAFLSTQREPFPVLKSTPLVPIAPEFWNKGDNARGQRLFHQVGCVACHEPDKDLKQNSVLLTDREKKIKELGLGPDELEELGLDQVAKPVTSVPLGDLASKYVRESLTHFLIDPMKARPAGRMPSLKLAPADTADVAAYLLRDQKSLVKAEPAGDDSLVAKGRALFSKLGCASCHDAKDVAAKPAKPLASLDMKNANCVTREFPGLPRYQLDDHQRFAIEAALTNERAETAASQQFQWRLLQANCYACHEHNKRGGVGPRRMRYFETAGHIDMGDEGRMPPSLDGVGTKLHASWIKKVLDGTGDVRPHMLARMPKFPPALTSPLPAAFVRADGVESADVFEDIDAPVEAGRELLGMGCIQCHPLRGEHMPGVQGVDLAGIHQRVGPHWFRKFLLNPAAVKSRTRMPTFFPNGKSQDKDLLHGNVDRQIAAMWSYLKDVDRLKLPEKLEQGKEHNFELVPTDRPILLRTFMKDAGPHAIAVGFPQRVHFAFDSENVRAALIWRGPFLNAHGTWFDRFTPLEQPLGRDVVKLPARQPFFAKTNEEPEYRFLGYRLDKQGVPTLLYQYNDFKIEDRIEPVGKMADGMRLSRQLTIINPGEDQPLCFSALLAKKLTKVADRSYKSDAGLTVTVESDGQSICRDTDEEDEFLIRFRTKKKATFKVTYQW